MKKNPWIAAVLNFLLYGAGYVYNGKHKGFGVALIFAWIVLRYADIQLYINGTVMNHWYALMAGLAILQFTFAIHAYGQAKELNEEN